MLPYRESSVIVHVQVARKGKRGVWLKDFGQALAMYWVLIQVHRQTTVSSQLQTSWSWVLNCWSGPW